MPADPPTCATTSSSSRPTWPTRERPGVLDRALDGVDAVCHQAAMVGLGRELGDVVDYARDNDLGTAVLLAAVARRRIGRLVLASS
ncbi:MAG TPA: NAD-dependent epimerase/dehydratase family protein, partial [Actinomycetes bacterium]|nr:NAD-dependent epimerase/dehydratase family protein [Actinomycetes bacterium]